MALHDFSAAPRPADQADGLRRLFGQSRVRLIPVAANPHVAFAGALLEQLCAALVASNVSVLLVDAADSAPVPHELSVMGLASCIEPLAPRLGYLAARGLPMAYLDAHGSTAPFLQAVVDAAPGVEVVLVHAGATELGRLFTRQTLGPAACPVLLADDRPASVTHAYASMKLLAVRARLMVHHLVLGAAGGSPRAERIAEQMASCADLFLGAVLRSWARVDPRAFGAVAPGLERLARELVEPSSLAGDAPPARPSPDGAWPRAHAAAARAQRVFQQPA